MPSRNGTRSAALAAVGLTVLLTGAVLIGVLGSGPQPPKPVGATAPADCAGTCAGPLPTASASPTSSASASPAPSASASSTPSATPSSTETAASRYCRVLLTLPKTARAGRPLRIEVSATDGCFTGPTRSLSTSLRKTTGDHRAVSVTWSSKGGPHDVVLRRGVPSPGHWRLDLTSGTGLSSGVSGTLVAR